MKKMMKNVTWKNAPWKKIPTLAAAALMMAVLVGCGSASSPQTIAPSQTSIPEESAAPVAVGSLLLSVNPEIEVEYDSNGHVLDIDGINDDGELIVTNYRDYLGKDCHIVVNELVQAIYQAGYFENTIDGQAKNIVIKLDNEAANPGGNFLEQVAESVREAVRTCGIASNAVVVREDDLDESGYIGIEKAKELALTQLGLTNATFRDHEYDLDDGIYELEFVADGIEYEFEVDALTGKVLKADLDNNDDWNDRDDWDDLNDFDDFDDHDDDWDDLNDRDDLDDHDDFDDRDDFNDRYDLDDRDDLDDRYDLDDRDDFDDFDDRDDLDDRDDFDDWDDLNDRDDFDDYDDDDDRDDDDRDDWDD